MGNTLSCLKDCILSTPGNNEISRFQSDGPLTNQVDTTSDLGEGHRNRPRWRAVNIYIYIEAEIITNIILRYL